MKHIKIILNKMCDVVGAKNIDFKEEGWFLKHEWTEEQEKEFINWMQEYLMKNKDARNEIMARPNKSKKDIEKVVDEFIFNYGWKIDYNEEI